MTKPVRIQLRRTKGWCMPPNTVSVARPTVFGNPFTVSYCLEAGYKGTEAELRAMIVRDFRSWLTGSHENWTGEQSEKTRAKMLAALPKLKGKNLACFCPLDQPCHADVLLELANKETP